MTWMKSTHSQTKPCGEWDGTMEQTTLMPKTMHDSQNSSCTDTETCETDTTMLSASQESGHVQPKGNGETNAKTSNRGGFRLGGSGPQPGSGRPRKIKQPAAERLLSAETGPRWYVLRIAPFQHTRVMWDLSEGETRRGYIPRPSYEVYLPQIAARRVVNNVKTAVIVPMIPGYAFVRFDYRTDDWKPIRSCDGVLELMSTRGLIPIPIRDKELNDLRSLSEQSLGIDPLKTPIMPARLQGDMLRMSDGAFAGHEATCIACDGLTTKAELSIFGRQVPVEMPWTAFEAA